MVLSKDRLKEMIKRSDTAPNKGAERREGERG